MEYDTVFIDYCHKNKKWIAFRNGFLAPFGVSVTSGIRIVDEDTDLSALVTRMEDISSLVELSDCAHLLMFDFSIGMKL